MPIFVEGEMLDKNCLSVSLIIERFPDLENNAKAFRSQSTREVPSSGLLYVMQREFATVSPADGNVTVMGSEDATTCHIVCIRNKGTGTTSLCHLDGCAMEEAINNMVDSVSDGLQNEIDLHMFGGFLDDRQISVQITHGILSSFHSNSSKINLCTFCVTDLNDTVKNGLHYPVVYGVAINVKTGEFFPATFPHKGPDYHLRHVRCLTHGHEKVIQVYNSTIGELQIGPFNYEFFRKATFFMNAPDDSILKTLSTSPHCESPSFCDETRATMTYLVNNPEPLKTVFPDGAPHRYTRNSDNEWQRVGQA